MRSNLLSAGSVTLRVHPDSDNGHLLFTVADTGLGIASDELETLFEPFAGPKVGQCHPALV